MSHQLQLEDLKTVVSNVCQSYYADLSEALEGKTLEFARQLFQRNIISNSVMRSANYDDIMTDYIAGLKLIDSSKETVEIYCQHLLESLNKLGEEPAKVSKKLKKKWQEEVSKKFNGMFFLAEEITRTEELYKVQKNLLGMLPERKPNRRQKKNEQNRSSHCFLRYYNTIVATFSKNIEILESVAVKLTEVRVIDAAQRDQIKRITYKSIKIQALMEAVDAMIKKAVQPHIQLRKFMGVLNFYECFHHVIYKLQQQGFIPLPPAFDSASQVSHTCIEEIKLITGHGIRIDTDEEIERYAKYLRCVYEKKLKPSGWPHITAWKFVDLAIVNSDRKKGHKLIKLHELVQCKQNSPVSVLLKGAPGVGKSSLAAEICKKWSQGELYSHFKLVVLLHLRSSSIQKAKKLEDLIPNTYHKSIEPLVDCLGMGVLFILEGYDELPEAQRESGLLHYLMEELPKASVMVTSRHWATVSISRLFEKQVEILGFTESSRMEYITSVLSNDEASAFKRELIKLSSIRDCLNVPLYLVTLVEIYKEGSNLPETVTQLYNVLINTQLLRVYFRSQSSKKPFSVPPGEFNMFPKNMYLCFLNICEIAYEVTITGCFPELPEDYETLDLLYHIPLIDPASGISLNYSFLHASVREYLAAYYISRKEPDDIKQHIEQMQLCGQFSLVIEFLSGFGKNSKLANTNILSKVNSFDIFRQLCEAQDDILIKEILTEPQERTILRTWPVPTPHDLWCLGRCIGFSQCKWELSFTFRHLKGEHLVMLCDGIESVKHCQGQIKEFNLSLNKLDVQGLKRIFNLPQRCLSTVEFINLRANHLDVAIPNGFCNLPSLQTFLFHDNEIPFHAHHSLIQALKNEAAGIEHVSFSNLSREECALLLSIPSLKTIELWQICSDSVMAVVNAIAGKITLKTLEIYQSKIDNENIEELRWSLPTCQITSLVFSNCAIDCTATEIIALAVTRSESMKRLDLSDNMISHKGGLALVNLLEVSHSLMELNLVHNRLSRDNVYWLRRMKPHHLFL